MLPSSILVLTISFQFEGINLDAQARGVANDERAVRDHEGVGQQVIGHVEKIGQLTWSQSCRLEGRSEDGGAHRADLAGSAGIAFAFAFASFIGFEATAIYGEESKDPKTVVPRATYLAVGVITVLFAVTSFAMVTGMGASSVVEKFVELSTVDGIPLADPAAVLFALATQYVGPWMATLMGFLVLSSLFAGLLAFQNATSRYLFALGRGGTLPTWLSQVNRRGVPSNASLVTSVIAGLVIVAFAVLRLDPVLNLFYWFSALSVVAIMLIEILVCIPVIVYFSRNKGRENVFQTVIAPSLAVVGLVIGEYLLMSRFGLLSGTVADGVDPTVTAWGLSPTGWVLIALPFVLLIVGYAHSLSSKRENEDLIKDVPSATPR